MTADDKTPAATGVDVVDEQVVWLDAQGQPCDSDDAVRGEITQRMADGSTRHTAFTC